MQCTEKIERASSETKSEAVDIKSPGKSEEDGVSADWSRSSPSKKVGDGPELSSDALHDMAAVLDRSAGAGDQSLQEVRNSTNKVTIYTISIYIHLCNEHLEFDTNLGPRQSPLCGLSLVMASCESVGHSSECPRCCFAEVSTHGRFFIELYLWSFIRLRHLDDFLDFDSLRPFV